MIKWVVVVRCQYRGYPDFPERRDVYGPYKKRWVANLLGWLYCHCFTSDCFEKEYWVTEEIERRHPQHYPYSVRTPS